MRLTLSGGTISGLRFRKRKETMLLVRVIRSRNFLNVAPSSFLPLISAPGIAVLDFAVAATRSSV
jgi:hypothetical protein